MFRSVAKHHSPIAVDLGSASLHVLQVDGRQDRLALHRWCELPLPGAPASKSDQSGASPAQTPWPAIGRERFIGHEVAVSLGPPDVECAPLRVPENLLKLEHHQLLAAIRHEVGRHINQPTDAVEMDVWRLVPGHLDAPNLMVAAVRRELIARVLAWLDGQGLVCRRVDIAPLAALRACARLTNRPADDQLWGVLDVGRCAVRLYIAIDETPVYVRCIPKGGEEMTRRISEELGVDMATAESYKRHYGVHSPDGHCRAGSPPADAVDSRRMAGILLGVLRPTLRGMSEDIQRSFRYAMGLYPDRTVAGLWVIGGGAELSGLPEMLHDLLGITVHKAGSSLLPATWRLPPGWSEQATVRSLTSLGTCLGELN